MVEVLTTAVALPTVLFTVLLSLSVVYWGLVVAGAVDLDGSDGAAEGSLKGVTEGALKGATEGALKGAAEGALKGAAEGVLDSTDGAHGPTHGPPDGALGTLLSALGFSRAPATVVLSLVGVFGWVTSTLSTLTLVPALPLPSWLSKVLVLALSLVVALFATSFAVRPLAPLFRVHKAARSAGLVGRTATVSTGRVGRSFGQAQVDDGGAGLILDVRHDVEGLLRKGDRVLLVHFDEAQNAFEVEPLDPTARWIRAVP
jgi:hypothetical protein